MTSHAEGRRRRGEAREIDLEDLDPREGLWRFAWSWLTRASVHPSPAIPPQPSPSPAIPPEGPSPPLPSGRGGKGVRSARGPKGKAQPSSVSLELRRRAHAWLMQREKGPAVEAPPKRKRAVKPAASIGLRQRALAWLTRRLSSAEGPAKAEPEKRKRGLKQEVGVELRRRAFLWFRSRRAAAPAIAAPAPAGAGSDVVRAHLKGVLEALIFASEHPLPAKELARVARAELKVVKLLLTELMAEYHHRGVRLDEVAHGYVFRTSPAFAPFVREQVAKKPVKMSRAQIETLAIVAYRQPITRPEIDEVRGVDSGAVLKSLLERDLVRILGKKEEPGRPMLYGTTPDFLEFFGLKQLGDLPTLREFTELTDESRRTYEQEMGEDPRAVAPAAEHPQGLMGGEGTFREPEVTPLEQDKEGAALPAEASAEGAVEELREEASAEDEVEPETASAGTLHDGNEQSQGDREAKMDEGEGTEGKVTEGEVTEDEDEKDEDEAEDEEDEGDEDEDDEEEDEDEEDEDEEDEDEDEA